MFNVPIDFQALRVNCKRAIELCWGAFTNRRMVGEATTETTSATQRPGFLTSNGMGSLEIGASHD